MDTATKKRPATKRPPTKPTKPRDVSIKLTDEQAATLFRAARIIAPFASTDEARAVLCCVRFRSTGTSLLVEATDSCRLARIELPGFAVDPFDVAIDERWLVATLPKGKPGNGQFTVTFGERFTLTDHDADSVASRKTLTVFPNTDALFDRNSEQPEMDGETPRGFNPKYLASIFKAAQSWPDRYEHAPLVVRHLDPLRPCFFEVQALAGKLTMLLMPVRLA